jgi:hypothetical protein
MNRYQIYLDPHSVATIDEAAQLTGISRSQMIRGVIDRYAQAVAQVFAQKKVKQTKTYHFDKLHGILSVKDARKPASKKNAYSLEDDSIYLID